MSPRIGVLVVDDSPTIRQVLVNIISEHPSLMVIGEANDGAEAVQQTRKLRPDVISMDIHMPVLDGFGAVHEIMHSQPTPIVVVSGSLDHSETNVAFDAIRAGALAVLQKPPGPDDPAYLSRCEELVNTLHAMAGVSVIHHWPSSTTAARTSPPSGLPANRQATEHIDIVGIVSSTGGPAALAAILGVLPADFPVPIVIVQHISSGFEDGLATWLDRITSIRVQVAQYGQRVAPGIAYIAPSGQHMKITRSGVVVLEHDREGYVNVPSGDVLLESLAESYGARAFGVVATGMGADGAIGLRAIFKAGGHTIAQDEATSVVYGMPKEAAALGGARYIKPLGQIGRTIMAFTAKQPTTQGWRQNGGQ